VFVSEALSVNENGHLSIGGCDCLDLAARFGTPLYVMDEDLIRKNCRTYKDAMEKYYGENGKILYASKAFSTMAMCKIAEQEGLGLDVVSAGELYTALASDFPRDMIYFHGNNKSDIELDVAIDSDIYCIVVDNLFELRNLNAKAAAKGKVVKIAFRIKPGIDAHTHDFVQTGQIDSKFGVALENGEALEAVRVATEMTHVELIGVHCHIGSQIFDLAPFQKAAEVMLGFVAEIKEKYGVHIQELNLGGGYGIKYVPSNDPIEYDKYIESVRDTVEKTCAALDLEIPMLVMEPGRSIVASAGITLYTIGGVKKIENVRTYVSVDGGMADNPRYALYQSEYDAVIANRPEAEKDKLITIAGKCCESGDLLAKDILMPEVEVGEILAMLATGAYNYSMSSNYNRIPKPPVVLVKDGKARLIVKREDYEDIVRNDLVPADL